MSIKSCTVFFLAGLLIVSVMQLPVMAADFYSSNCGPGGVICSELRRQIWGGISSSNLTEKLKKEYRETGDICCVVKRNIREGLSARDVAISSINLGHDACLVVRCAVEANGNLEQIITGAIEAGTTSDVCARCAMNAGANPNELAKILETGLGYSPVPGAGLTTIETSLPGGQKGGGVVSSSRFR